MKIFGVWLGFVLFTFTDFSEQDYVSENMSIFICIIFMFLGGFIGSIIDKNKTDDLKQKIKDFFNN